MRKFLPKEGDTRIKTKFLILPKIINHERRWLEIASYKQQVSIVKILYDASSVEYVYGWKDIEWINK